MEESTAIFASVDAAAPVTSRRKNYLYQENAIVADWLNVLKWCFIPILVCTVYWAIEKYISQVSPRLVYNPAEFPARVIGLSHFAVGLLFMLSANKMKRVGSWIWLVGLFLLGVMLCAFFNQFGADRNPVMVICFFLFFMVHSYRDIVSFYRRPDDDPTLENLRSYILVLTQACLLLSLFYFLVPAYLLYRISKPKSYTPEQQAQIKALMPFLHGTLQWVWVLLLASLVGLWQLVKRLPEGWRSVWATDKAVLLVLLYTSLIILASPLVGPWTYNVAVLLHVVGWYFYASRRLATLPKQSSPADGLWQWFRGSVNGFQWLHVGVAAAFLIAVFINHFVFEGVGILNMLVSSTSFYYWAIVHVTISFAPRS